MRRAQNEDDRVRINREGREAESSFFNWTSGAEYSIFRSRDNVYHVASSEGDTFLTTADRGGWRRSNRNFIGTMTFADQPKNLIFERTCYDWHFNVEVVDGLRFNHAWTLTGLDFMVPEGEVHRIGAPMWYVNQKKLRMQEEARALSASRPEPKGEVSRDRDVFAGCRRENVVRSTVQGYLREAMYGTLYAHKESSQGRDGKGFAEVALTYYEKAVDTLRPVGYFVNRVALEMSTPGGVENLRKYRDGEISESDFNAAVTADLAADAAASGIGAWLGGAAGGAGMAYATAGGGAAAGVSAGSAAGATLAYISARSLKAVTRATINYNANASGEDTNKGEQLARVRSRVQRTDTDLTNYFKRLKSDPDWKFYRSDGSGKHKAYKNTKTGEIRYNDNTHKEVECFDSKRRHFVRDCVTDELLLNKPKHSFPDWLK